jgi:single-strand DNA-binding protein
LATVVGPGGMMPAGGARCAITDDREDAEMINDAQVVLTGFVVSAPYFRHTAKGNPATTLRVAYTPRHVDRDTGEWADGETSFVNVLCYRTLASNVAMCLRKGEPVLVRGRLRVRPYQDKEGAPRIAVEVDAQAVGHDLTRGVAHFSRTQRAAGETAAESAQTQAAAQSQPPGEDQAGLQGPAGSSTGGDVLDERAVAEFVGESGQAADEDLMPPEEPGSLADDDRVPADGAAVR